VCDETLEYDLNVLETSRVTTQGVKSVEIDENY